MYQTEEESIYSTTKEIVEIWYTTTMSLSHNTSRPSLTVICNVSTIAHQHLCHSFIHHIYLSNITYTFQIDCSLFGETDLSIILWHLHHHLMDLWNQSKDKEKKKGKINRFASQSEDEESHQNTLVDILMQQSTIRDHHEKEPTIIIVFTTLPFYIFLRSIILCYLNIIITLWLWLLHYDYDYYYFSII